MYTVNYGAIVVAAGNSVRMGKPKQFLPLAGKTVLRRCVDALDACGLIGAIAVVVRGQDRTKVSELLSGIATPLQIVTGGNTRQESVRCGVHALCKAGRPQYLVIHDGARPLLQQQDLHQVCLDAAQYGAAALCMPVYDTVKAADEAGFVKTTLNRDTLRLMATPQVFETDAYLKALAAAEAAGRDFTDDCQLMEFVGRRVYLTPCSRQNIKITSPEDLLCARAYLQQGEKMMRIGHGYDVHRLVCGRKLMLGGVEIPYEFGLLGHSDADVLLHAVSDALLGAVALGDIGKLFPDNDPAYAGADSFVLLQQVCAAVQQAGYRVGNIDCTVLAQAPKLSPYREQMQARIAAACSCSTDCVSVKATTEEGLGFTGSGQGIAAHAVCMLVGG